MVQQKGSEKAALSIHEIVHGVWNVNGDGVIFLK